jgi:negative regulator of flagellin synthesis FlgM
MSYSNGIGDWKQTIGSVSPASASETRTAIDRTKTADTKPPSRTNADETKFSPIGESMAQALSGSDVRSSKVEALQKSIADGTYKVSSTDVADKIIQSLLD